MEEMWDEGLTPVWLPLNTGVTPRGGNSWPQPKNTNYSQGLVPGAQATPAGSRPGGVLALVREEECAASSAPVQRCNCITKCSLRPNSRCTLWADRGAGKTILSILLAERALGLAHQAHRHFRLLSGASWWVPRQELFYSSACISKLGSLSTCFSKTHMLVQLPCCFAGISLDTPCGIWGVFDTSELAYQLHMYKTDPLTTKTLSLLLEITGIFLKWSKLSREQMWKPSLDDLFCVCLEAR